MKVSEILRDLANYIDQVHSDDESSGHTEPVEVDNDDDTESETMVSPLQQKHEILKKAADKLDHPEYEPDQDFEQVSDEDEMAELEMLKKCAGIYDVKPVPGDDMSSMTTIPSINPKMNAALEARKCKK